MTLSNFEERTYSKFLHRNRLSKAQTSTLCNTRQESQVINWLLHTYPQIHSYIHTLKYVVTHIHTPTHSFENGGIHSSWQGWWWISSCESCYFDDL